MGGEVMDSNIVWTVNDYFDGCKIGVADYENIHCIYERIFNEEKDDWTNNYFLTPISQSDFSLIISDWERWKEWRKNFDNGKQQDTFVSKVNLESISLSSNEYRKKICRGTFSSGNWAYCDNMKVKWSNPTK